MLQAVAGETPEVSPGEQDRYPLQTEDSTALQQTTDPEDEQEEEEAEAVPAGYVSRRTTDPYMQKKLRGLQVEPALNKSKVRFLLSLPV